MKETQKFTEIIELRLAALVAAGLALTVCINSPVAASKSIEARSPSGSTYKSPPKPPNHDILSDVLIAPPPRFQLPSV